MAMTEAMFVHIFISKSYNPERKQVVPRTLIWLYNLSKWQKVSCVQESCGWVLILYDSFLMQTCTFLVLEITLFIEAHVSLVVLGRKNPCDYGNLDGAAINVIWDLHNFSSEYR